MVTWNAFPPEYFAHDIAMPYALVTGNLRILKAQKSKSSREC